MRFSKMVDYKGKGFYLCRTGRRNCRILEPGQPYEKSFVVPIKHTSNKRAADVVQDENDEIDLNDEVELAEPTEDAGFENEYQPQ